TDADTDSDSDADTDGDTDTDTDTDSDTDPGPVSGIDPSAAGLFLYYDFEGIAGSAVTNRATAFAGEYDGTLATGVSPTTDGKFGDGVEIVGGDPSGGVKFDSPEAL